MDSAWIKPELFCNFLVTDPWLIENSCEYLTFCRVHDVLGHTFSLKICSAVRETESVLDPVRRDGGAGAGAGCEPGDGEGGCGGDYGDGVRGMGVLTRIFLHKKTGFSLFHERKLKTHSFFSNRDDSYGTIEHKPSPFPRRRCHLS